MTRLKVTELQIPDRLPQEGFCQLYVDPETKDRGPDPDPKWDLIQPALRDVLAELAQGKSPWPLFLFGKVGTGKTEAVRAFCRKVYRAWYWTVDKLMDEAGHDLAPWHGAYAGVRLGILDELGVPRPGEKAKAWDYECVKHFLDWRQNQPAIYVSNHDLQGVKRLYDARIESRLAAGTVFELKDHDRRRRQ